jgi:hypothetical protein
MTYTYAGTVKSDPFLHTCGDKRGTNTGYNRHFRAHEKPCSACARAAARYRKERRARYAGEHLAYQRARARALRALARRHRAEFKVLMRTALADVYRDQERAWP